MAAKKKNRRNGVSLDEKSGTSFFMQTNNMNILNFDAFFFAVASNRNNKITI